MKEFRIVIILCVLTVFVFIFIICSCLGGAGAAEADKTTGGEVDMSPMPANSEFLNDE